MKHETDVDEFVKFHDVAESLAKEGYSVVDSFLNG